MEGFLPLIWSLSLALVLFSFIALGALIVARLRRRREEADARERRARISKALLRFAIAGAEAPKLSLSKRLDRKLLIETALDAAQILRGEAKQRLIGYLRDIGLDRKLQRLAGSSKLRVRLNAIEALRLFPDSATLVALRRAERSGDLRLWLAALQARTAIGHGPDTLGLLELAKRPGAGRSPILGDLLAARAKENAAEAINALQAQLSDPARAMVVRALGETERAEALAPLRVALFHSSGQVRTAAAEALGALGFAGAQDGLIRATRDVDWRVRLKAVEAISRLRLHDCSEQLQALCSDPVWWVRFRAEEALRLLSEASLAKLRTLSDALATTPPADARSR